MTSKVVWYSHLLKNFPQFVAIHSVKAFSVVNEENRDVFLEFPCFLHVPMNIGSFISSSSISLQRSLYIWKFLIHLLLNGFDLILASMWNEGNFMVYWTFFSIALLWSLNEIWPFPVLWPLLNFPGLLAYFVEYLRASSFRILNIHTVSFWEGLRAGGKGDGRGWDGWMASPTWWTWVWANSGSWWWTERPGMLQFMGWESQTRLSDWTEHPSLNFVAAALKSL